MAWNEPDDKNKGKEPWGGGNGKQEPPDLDEALRKFQAKLRRFIAGKSGGNGGDVPTSVSGGLFGLGFILIAVLVLWILSGIFIVGPAEKAVVLRFGKYTSTLGSGPHWIPRFIDTKDVIDVQKIAKFDYSAQMLTKDENIVSVTVAVQYRIGDARDFLFNVVNPLMSLQQATASALRQVTGHSTLDEIITVGRDKVRYDVQKQLNKILLRYNAGLIVTQVALQSAKAPEEVKAAFDDAIKAQEDEQRFINQAQAYSRGVLPIAEGNAKRILQAAGAYKQRVILQAKGNVSQFLALLPEYTRAPKVTRERLYLDTVESVLAHTSKVLVDVKGSNNMFYLPLDRLLKGESSPVEQSKTVDLTQQAPLRLSGNQASSRLSRTEATTRPSRVTARLGRDSSYRGRGTY